MIKRVLFAYNYLRGIVRRYDQLVFRCMNEFFENRYNCSQIRCDSSVCVVCFLYVSGPTCVILKAGNDVTLTLFMMCEFDQDFSDPQLFLFSYYRAI